MLIKEYQTEEYQKAIEWGRNHPELMGEKDTPFDFMDKEWELWARAKYVEKLSSLPIEEQKKYLSANKNMRAKMNS